MVYKETLSPGRAALVAQLVKNLPAMQETWIQSRGWEDPLEKGTGYTLQYSSLENSMDCIVHGVTKSQTRLSEFHFQLFLKYTDLSPLCLHAFICVSRVCMCVCLG